MTDLRLTAAEAAEITGKSRRTIGRLLAAGRLPGAERTAQGWRIPRDALDNLDTVPAPAAEAAPLADLRAELEAWRRRAEVAEAVAAERAEALADARSALVLAQRFAALNLAENVTYRTDAREITGQAASSVVHQWIPRRWRKNR
jgi:excisionase family DNA binding protein